jgi:transcriptional regulator with XRE-family HTH domain
LRRRVMALAREPEGATHAPEIMRRRLRLALREAREAAGVTQKQAAEALYASLSKIIRIEKGEVSISPPDLQVLLALYGVTDEERVAELVNFATASKGRSWSDYKDLYSPASLSLFGSEASAKTIYKYEPHFIPGLLQTEEYAEALLIGLGHSKQDVERMVRARLERQELLDREARPRLHLIIGEAAVSRAVGGRATMRRQLERIKKLAARPGMFFQILPFSSGEHPHIGGSFTILEFADLDDLLYLENAGGERTIRDEPAVLSEYSETFAILRNKSTSHEDLAEVLDRLRAERFEETSSPLTASYVSPGLDQ